MKKILKKIGEFLLQKHVLIAASLVCLVLVFPDLAHAATKEDDITKEIVAKTNVLIRFGSAMLWPILLLIGALLDNNLIFGSGMEERILSIWTQIRDFTNLLFVFILIIAALVNVFKGLGGEAADGGFEIKNFLKTFVIGLVVINFTFLGSKVVLDAANVVTSAVFALPNTALNTKENRAVAIQNTAEYCKRAREDAKKSSPDLTSTGYLKFLCSDENKGTQLALESMLSQYNTRNAAFALAVNMGKLQIQELKSDGVNFLKDYTINLLFSLVMYVIYLIAFVSMFLLLLGRLVVIWVAVVMSPLLAALVLFKDLPGIGSAGGDKADEWKKRLTSAITAPIILGVFMSIGYILLDAFRGVDNFYLDFTTGNTATKISGMEDLRDIMIALIAAGIVWIGVEVAKENSLFSSVIDNVTGLAKSVGKWIAAAPFKYIPLVPVAGIKGKGTAVSLADLGDISRGFMQNLENKRHQRIQNLLGFNTNPSTNVSKGTVQAYLRGANNKQNTTALLQNFLKSSESFKDKKLYTEVLKKAQQQGVITAQQQAGALGELTKKTFAVGSTYYKIIQKQIEKNTPKKAPDKKTPTNKPATGQQNKPNPQANQRVQNARQRIRNQQNRQQGNQGNQGNRGQGGTNPPQRT